ncbi:MAG TPA: ribonuclease III [Candidatus Moranbacteria bacterium]|nr:ribonuclease III [Candidatus Moranbacteria bacterium]
MFAEEFARKLGIKFRNLKLLEEALTHRSFLNEHRNEVLSHNERLEFLGDAVLELVVTDFLFKNYDNPEGELTPWRAALVNGEMLADISKKIGVESYLRMSKGEAKDTGKARRYILANAMEAIIGAIYLDQGYKVAENFISKNIISNIDRILQEKLYIDPKSHFQEEAQKHAQITPSYKVLSEEGPDHDKKFVMGVFLGEELVGEGEGLSKQEAQREAARNALKNKGWI